MTLGQLSIKHPSLAAMVDAIKIKLEISREALHQRFNPGAVSFLKLCLKHVIEQKITRTALMNINIKTKKKKHFNFNFNQFNRIILFDSSGWDLKEKLKYLFKGFGGTASKASCKLQVGYEYKKGELLFFDITKGTKSDNSYTDKLPDLLNPKDLIIFDQGYFKLQTFSRIMKRGAFFLTRFKINTSLFNPQTAMSLNLDEILKYATEDNYQVEVLMGSKVKIPCRLICMRVSEEIANKRRRKLIAESKKKGHTPQQKNLRLCDWTLLITNVPKAWLPPETLLPLYRLRWQIELIFKQFKSILKIHQSDTANKNRLLCEIYGKLIAAVLIHRIHGQINAISYNTRGKEVSMDKLYKRILDRAIVIMKLLLISLKQTVFYLKEEIPLLIKNCLKYKQKSRKNTLELLEEPPQIKVRTLETLLIMKKCA